MRFILKIVTFTFCISSLISSCDTTEDENPECNCDEKFGTFIDIRDGHKYKTIQIGEQVWIAENLSYLPKVSPPSEYSETESHFYVYDFDGTSISEAKATNNYKIYGVLYNWPAANKACPDGWHLPSNKEFETLCLFLGGEEEAGAKLKDKGTEHWLSPNSATNESCFAALSVGYLHKGVFRESGENNIWGESAAFWSATIDESYRLIYWFLWHNDSDFESGNDGDYKDALSVRCIKD